MDSIVLYNFLHFWSSNIEFERDCVRTSKSENGLLLTRWWWNAARVGVGFGLSNGLLCNLPAPSFKESYYVPLFLIVIYFLVYSFLSNLRLSSVNKMKLSITVLSFIFFFSPLVFQCARWLRKKVKEEKSIDVWIGKLLKYLRHSASSSFKLIHRLELSWVGPLVSLLRRPLLNSFVCVCVCIWVLKVIMDFLF